MRFPVAPRDGEFESQAGAPAGAIRRGHRREDDPAVRRRGKPGRLGEELAQRHAPLRRLDMVAVAETGGDVRPVDHREIGRARGHARQCRGAGITTIGRHRLEATQAEDAAEIADTGVAVHAP